MLMIFKCDYFLLPGLTCTASGWNVPALVICEENPDLGREALLLTLELGTTMAEVLTYELRPLFSSTPVPCSLAAATHSMLSSLASTPGGLEGMLWPGLPSLLCQCPVCPRQRYRVLLF